MQEKRGMKLEIGNSKPVKGILSIHLFYGANLCIAFSRCGRPLDQGTRLGVLEPLITCYKRNRILVSSFKYQAYSLAAGQTTIRIKCI
jgi:hypothetical protein